MGPSGAGKSSITQMIERFYDPTEGQVLIDGKDIKTLSLVHYRKQIGYVSQEPVLFNTTIRKNIIMGKPDATNDEIEEALRKSNSWEFVQNQPEGVDTHVGAGGNQLSGGQKQRLALARAFIKKPKMFIFDEATSALDKKNEREVQQAIDKMSQELDGVTSIVIAHRLSTIKNADRILVLNNGVLQESGNHESLLRDFPNGTYSKLVADQEKVDAAQPETENADVSAEITAQAKADKIIANKEKEELAEQQMVQANELKKVIDDEIEKALDPISNPKTQDKTFFKRIWAYNTPKLNAYIGVLFSVFNGVLGPIFGFLIIKTLFGMINNPFDLPKMRDEVDKWCLVMVIASFVSLFVTSICKRAFGVVAENVTLQIRSDLYKNILVKHVGWHDHQDNSAGVLSAVLAKDVQLLNGVSSEGLAIMVEAMCSMIGGVIVAFIFEWKLSLVALAISPLMSIGAIISTKIEQGTAGS